MFTVTVEAEEAVRQMTNTEVYPAAGLRIAKSERDRFTLTVVPQPRGDDIVVGKGHGANVYLDVKAAEALGDAVLNANVDRQGRMTLSLTRAGN